MKFLGSAVLAVSLLAGIAVSHPAAARCFWNGVQTICARHSYPAFDYRFYHRGYHRDFDRPLFYPNSFTGHLWR